MGSRSPKAAALRLIEGLAADVSSDDILSELRALNQAEQQARLEIAALSPPVLVVHADWGSAPRKRWMCVARWEEGRYCVTAPERVGQLDSFWARLRARAPEGPILVGFDFPVGLPVAYANKAGIQDFPEALAGFGHGAWAGFYSVCETAEEISVHRPFYPFNGKGTKQAHLLDGLGMASMNQLLRRCERKTKTRGAASWLFWTVGGKQVGKAAIIGWRDLIAPGLRQEGSDLQLWPFHGPLETLLHGNAIVVAETYPAEACLHLGMTPPGRGWSKTSPDGRRSQRTALHAWAADRDVRLEGALASAINDGFGDRKEGEDPFDATVGLFGMLDVVLGHRSPGAPRSPSVQRIEGWIFGQAADGS
ncbi:MAG: DUF429 domain-containing protein [Bacteroidota bacterium]